MALDSTSTKTRSHSISTSDDNHTTATYHPTHSSMALDSTRYNSSLLPYDNPFERSLGMWNSNQLIDLERIRRVTPSLFFYQRDFLHPRPSQHYPPSPSSDTVELSLKNLEKSGKRYSASDTSEHVRYNFLELELLRQTYGDQIFEQLDLETEAVNREVKHYQEMTHNVTLLGKGSELGPASRLLVGWYQPLLAAIKLKLAHFEKKNRSSKTERLYKALSQVSPEKLTVIALHTAIGLTLKKPQGLPYNQLVYAAAEIVQSQVNYERLRSHDPTLFDKRFGKANFNLSKVNKITRQYMVPQENSPISESKRHVSNESKDRLFNISSSHLSQIKTMETQLGSTKSEDKSGAESNGQERSMIRSIKFESSAPPSSIVWSRPFKNEIGSFLINTFIECGTFKYTQNTGTIHEVPAFEVSLAPGPRFSVRHIRLAKPIIDLISYEHVLQEVNNIRHYPMVTKPKPWNGPEDGGYFLYPANVIRFYNFEKQVQPLMDNHDHMDIIYQSLNALGETPWHINKQVYQVVKQAWVEGGGIGDIPSRQDLPIPVPGPEGKTSAWYRQIKRIQTENSNLHSLRCDLLLKLQVAEKFNDRTIYFPHNMDFRGRVYPIPPHLNHMGCDLCRGLLTFGEGLPLGPRGLYWLKIHLANLYGKDKLSFQERITFVDQHWTQIEDSALLPLRGDRWWLEAEDPWQCLACCFELVQAANYPQGHEFYSCALPIHQDGTCNGLQHYAALGGDEQGARSVNLLPANRPQDVYSDVSTLVEARIAQDAQNGLSIAQSLLGKVNRRIIKQTVMTSVYGVTFVGAREQISNAIKDRMVLDESERYAASVYLAKCTFDSIGEMFTGAKRIMDWFSTCAMLIAKQNRLVSWVSPLGLPIVQPYKKPSGKTTVKTAFQTFSLTDEASMPVHTSRQRSAFPPNFIHSLDSSHMLLTTLACKNRKLVFSSVHDSYWAHACNIDKMNVILRETFIHLHRQPILKHLLEYLQHENPDIQFPPIPKQGKFDLHQVMESQYFFN